jgi:hypothetical protein
MPIPGGELQGTPESASLHSPARYSPRGEPSRLHKQWCRSETLTAPALCVPTRTVRAPAVGLSPLPFRARLPRRHWRRLSCSGPSGSADAHGIHGEQGASRRRRLSGTAQGARVPRRDPARRSEFRTQAEVSRARAHVRWVKSVSPTQGEALERLAARVLPEEGRPGRGAARPHLPCGCELGRGLGPDAGRVSRVPVPSVRRITPRLPVRGYVPAQNGRCCWGSGGPVANR